MIVTAPLTGLLQILIPLALGAWIIRRYGTNWRLFGVGMVLFIASQVVHIPVLSGLTALFANGVLPTPPVAYALLINAVLLGLLAGLAEESARWLGFHFLKERARSWAAAVTLGIGHGGVESMLIGVSGLASFVVMVLARDNPSILQPSADQLTALLAQSQAYWASPWVAPLAGLLERLTALTLHIALSVLVLQTVLRRTAWFYLLAVLWHALVDGVAVYLVGLGVNVWIIEGVLLGFGLASLAIILAFRGRRPEVRADAGSVVTPD